MPPSKRHQRALYSLIPIIILQRSQLIQRNILPPVYERCKFGRACGLKLAVLHSRDHLCVRELLLLLLLLYLHQPCDALTARCHRSTHGIKVTLNLSASLPQLHQDALLITGFLGFRQLDVILFLFLLGSMILCAFCSSSSSSSPPSSTAADQSASSSPNQSIAGHLGTSPQTPRPDHPAPKPTVQDTISTTHRVGAATPEPLPAVSLSSPHLAASPDASASAEHAKETQPLFASFLTTSTNELCTQCFAPSLQATQLEPTWFAALNFWMQLSCLQLEVSCLLSSRDPLHLKFQKVNKCNGDVNVTKLNSKTKFPVTFTSFFLLPSKGWGFFVPFHSGVSRGSSLRPGGHFL